MSNDRVRYAVVRTDALARETDPLAYTDDGAAIEDTEEEAHDLSGVYVTRSSPPYSLPLVAP